MDADSTSWLDPVTDQVVVVPSSDVLGVTYRDRNPGAFDGFLVGLAVGVASGAALQFVPDEPMFLQSWVLPFALGTAGAGYDMLGGTLIRAPVTYRPTNDASVSPTAAQGL